MLPHLEIVWCYEVSLGLNQVLWLKHSYTNCAVLIPNCESWCSCPVVVAHWCLKPDTLSLIPGNCWIFFHHLFMTSNAPLVKIWIHYFQVCRNINQIKICMETGRTVILLNLENLYESLYDVLNQYYMYLGDSRYVDLGLQTHRVKCRVNDNFK